MAKQNLKPNEKQPEDRGMHSAPRNLSMRQSGGSPFSFTLSPFETFFSNPLSLMRRVTEEMDRATGFSGSTRETNPWVPAIEVLDQGGRYAVKVELPGLKPEDITVEVRDGALVIEGERKFEHEQNRGNVHRSERQYGRFFRMIPLPEEAEAEKAEAKFDSGVLQVTVPVPARRSNRRRIPVKAEAGTNSTTLPTPAEPNQNPGKAA